MLRLRRSEAQRVRVRESRDDDCIKLKTKPAALEALVASPKRIDLVASDLMQHYERRLEAVEGKAMIASTAPRLSAASQFFVAPSQCELLRDKRMRTLRSLVASSECAHAR